MKKMGKMFVKTALKYFQYFIKVINLKTAAKQNVRTYNNFILYAFDCMNGFLTMHAEIVV